jgi:hypothetical protein
MADERWKQCKHHHDGCACREHAWAEQVERLTDELAAAQTARQDLLGSTYCVSCGAKFEEDKPDTKGRVIAHVMTCPKHPMRVIEAQRDAALTAVTQLKFELDVEKSNYECLKGEFNRAVALAQEHCPKPVLGQAWLTDGIPLLAERAKRAEAEVARLKGETHCAYCGESFPIDVSCEQIGNHIQVCPKHPMRVVEHQLEEMRVAKVWMEQKAAKFRDQCDAERKRASELGAEVERLREAIKTAHADGASALVASFENTDPKARVCELEAEVARLKKERGNED